MASQEEIIKKVYCQVYMHFNYPVIEPRILAAILNALAPMESIQMQLHQIRVMLKDDIEVKIGHDPWIQVSTPDMEVSQKIAARIQETIIKAVKEVGCGTSEVLEI